MTPRTCALVVSAFAALSGCAAQLPWAPIESINQVAYREPGAPTITLMVAVTKSGSGAHTALMINASQRVIYDPAGTFHDKGMPERADLLYGVTPQALDKYIDYQAEEGLNWVMMTKVVSPEVAETALQTAIETGASMSGFCANNTSSIISRVPGFQGFPVELYPKKVLAAFSAIPGVTKRVVVQNDATLDLNK